jgi:acyl-CoA thioesterase-1
MRGILLCLGVPALALVSGWMSPFPDEAPPLKLGDDEKAIFAGMLKDFLFDPPRDAQRVRVKLLWGRALPPDDPQRYMDRNGWLIPGKEPRVVFTDGESIAAPPEKDRTNVDFLAECQAVQKEDKVWWNGKDDALTLAVWLYRRGHEPLAARLLALSREVAAKKQRNEGESPDPLDDLREDLADHAWIRLVDAYPARADTEALAHGRRLVKLYDEFAAHKYPQARHIVVDLERRLKKGTFEKAPPDKLPNDFAQWETARKIAHLLETLDEVDVEPPSSIGRLTFRHDYRVKALVEIGDLAVKPLIEALATDTRLTRTSNLSTVATVRDVEWNVLRTTLRLDTLDPRDDRPLSVDNDDAVKRTVAQLRRYWEKQGQFPIDQRLMNMLVAPESNDFMRLEAARAMTGGEYHGIGGPLPNQWHLWNDRTPHPVVTMFKDPTAGEAMLAALEVQIKRREAGKPEPFTHLWGHYKHEYQYLEALINLGDVRIGPRLAAHARRQTDLARRNQYAVAAHIHGDSSALKTLADELRTAKLELPDVAQVIEQPSHPLFEAFRDILNGLVYSKLREADRALAALTQPGHRFYPLTRHLLLTAWPRSSENYLLFSHPYWVALLRHSMNDTALSGAIIEVTGEYVARVIQTSGENYSLPPEMANTVAWRKQTQEERVCDHVFRRISTTVLGMPFYHPLLKDTRAAQFAITERLNTFDGRLRPAAYVEKWHLGWFSDPHLILDIRPLERPATAEDVKAGRAVFHLEGTGTLAEGLRLPAWLVLKVDATKECPPASLVVQAEVGADGEIVYGVLERHGLRRIPGREVARLKPYGAPEDGPIKIVALGDSITRGVRPGVKAEETFAALLQAELRKQKLEAEVVNAGVGGERTDQALKRLAGAVLAAKPKAVLLMYGTNDSYVDRGQKDSRLTAEQYRAYLKELVTRLRNGGSEPILMTPPRWGERAAKNGAGEHPNVRLEQYVKVCREVAGEMKVALVDHFAHWSRAASAGTDLGTWTTDQCHPNPRGHRELAEQTLPVLVELLRKGAAPE